MALSEALTVHEGLTILVTGATLARDPARVTIGLEIADVQRPWAAGCVPQTVI